jgi:N-glycosylase/DNA lyase
MKLELDLRSTPFNLDSTLQCGQLFRWEKRRNSWYGVVKGRVLKVQQNGAVLSFRGADPAFVTHYFRLEDNLPQIVSEISRDAVIQQAVQAFPGMRLARQDPWECLISYMCATYKSIPAIRTMILRLSKRLGDPINHAGQPFYAFPEPKALAAVSISELRSCGLGFRAKRIREVARKTHSGEVDFEQLEKADYPVARAKLQQLPGVGNKVADCVLLFSLEKLEAFPIDVRIKRIIERHYSAYSESSFNEKLPESDSLSERAYKRMGSFARSYFGRYAGYAQEYLYHSAGKLHLSEPPSLQGGPLFTRVAAARGLQMRLKPRWFQPTGRTPSDLGRRELPSQ